MANKQIIILEVNGTDIGDQSVRYAMWFYPPVANQVPKPGFVSSWRGASATDTTNLQAGTVVEEVRIATFANNMSVPEFKAYLINVYNARASQINSAPNPNAFYGAFFDGATWTGV